MAEAMLDLLCGSINLAFTAELPDNLNSNLVTFKMVIIGCKLRSDALLLSIMSLKQALYFHFLKILILQKGLQFC